MLYINIPKSEHYDRANNMFYYVPETTLKLEHSLIAISKWESIWKKPFIRGIKEKKTEEELMDYIKCMTINQVNPLVYKMLTPYQKKEIVDYIEDSKTATTFGGSDDKRNNKDVTSEEIYSWMVGLNIPFDAEKWHLSRLLTLIKICSINNNPKKRKMSKSEIYSQNKALNEARKKKYNVKG